MTAVALEAPPACSFPVLRECVTVVLLDLAALQEPEATGCPMCRYAQGPVCLPHAEASLRISRAAVMASKAVDRDGVQAALEYALADGSGAGHE